MCFPQQLESIVFLAPNLSGFKECLDDALSPTAPVRSRDLDELNSIVLMVSSNLRYSVILFGLFWYCSHALCTTKLSVVVQP